jgi:hypothetical protein
MQFKLEEKILDEIVSLGLIHTDAIVGVAFVIDIPHGTLLSS